MDPSATSDLERVHVMKNHKKNPKLSELEGTVMTLSGEEESLMSEATRNLSEFAMTKGHTIHTVTQMSKTQLADFLRDFYGKVKLKNDDSLTLKDLRAGLHKLFLLEANVDILRDNSFELANTTFDLALKANRRCHRMRIELDDLKKIYLSNAMDTNNPESLQNKVFFDVSLYICNKSKDYFKNMKKTDFDVITDNQGHRSVLLKNTSVIRENEDQSTYKRGTDDDPSLNQVGEKMYERPGDPRCPLSSFLKYITHLHPMTDAFWQRPKRSVSQSDYVWYDHTPLGSSTLTKIMQRISIQAGLSDNYTNYSIRTACIPLVERVCEEAMRAEGGRMSSPSQTPVNVVKPSVPPPISHSTSEDMSSADECLSQTSDHHHHHASKEMDNGGVVHTNGGVANTNGAVAHTKRLSKHPPSLHSSGSGGSMDMEDSDCDLMQAKSQVLSLIRGLKVNDIQNFVDWLKTVRVQYNAGELIVLCSPVDKSRVEPIPDDVTVDRNGFASRTGTPIPTSSDPHLKKSASLDLSDKRSRLRKETSIKGGEHPLDLKMSPASELSESTVIKQVEFDHVAGVHCSTSESGPFKITIPSDGTVLLTSIPDSLQLMLHKKLPGPPNVPLCQEPLPARIFTSESKMDMAEVVGLMTTSTTTTPPSSKPRHHGLNSHGGSVATNSSSIQVISNNMNYLHSSSQDAPQVTTIKSHHLQVSNHNNCVAYPLKHRAQQMTLGVPAAHSPVMSSLAARDHFKEYRNKSMGCLVEPSRGGMADGMTLKRGSSTGTPVLKRQAHVDVGSMYPENLSVKKLCEEPAAQATNLSMKPVMKKAESLEDKKARADRLTDSLRYHQEILKNSPLVKRPGERNFSGFRHCYANTMGNSVKAEPQDTSYS